MYYILFDVILQNSYLSNELQNKRFSFFTRHKD